MKSTVETQTAGKEYDWKWNGSDGLRSYSYAQSNSAWNYAVRNGTNSDGAYTFSDSSTGQPSARRGNLYNLTAATLGSSLGLTSGQAPDSICPRGWRLPIDDWQTNKSWGKLLDATYGVSSDSINSINRASEWPLEYLPTGDYYFGYVGDRTTDGRWWTDGTSFGGDGADLWLGGDIFDIENANMGHGFALRCQRQKAQKSAYLI